MSFKNKKRSAVDKSDVDPRVTKRARTRRVLKCLEHTQQRLANVGDWLAWLSDHPVPTKLNVAPVKSQLDLHAINEQLQTSKLCRWAPDSDAVVTALSKVLKAAGLPDWQKCRPSDRPGRHVCDHGEASFSESDSDGDADGGTTFVFVVL